MTQNIEAWYFTTYDKIGGDIVVIKMVEESIVVQPQLGVLQKLSAKVKQVAFTSLDPVFIDSNLLSNQQSYSELEIARRQLIGFRLQIQGPEKDVNYFQRLLKEANLITYPAMQIPSPDFLL